MKKNILIIVIITISILIYGVILYNTKEPTQEENDIFIYSYLKDLGYKYDEETSTYKKITTNNTLEDFYNTISNNQETSYQEFYFQLDSYNFIELNMEYSNGLTEVYNAVSDLKNKKITYSYEINKNNASAIVEGEYNELESNPFTCEIANLKKLTEKGKDSYCRLANSYTKTFIEEQNNLLQNEEFYNKINIPRREIILVD